MKTTIDIPEPLYKQAKIRAVENGQTLKQFVLISLSRELDFSTATPEARKSFNERRKLLPGFVRAVKAGAVRPAKGHHDITAQISEDRDAR